MNGHDRAATDRRRQHVVRRMVDVGPLAPQDPGHVDLLAQRVVGRRFEHGAEVRAELRGDAQVGLMAEQDVLGVAIDPREVPQQVADVGADAEVVELPRVDRDAHTGPLYRCDPLDACRCDRSFARRCEPSDADRCDLLWFRRCKSPVSVRACTLVGASPLTLVGAIVGFARRCKPSDACRCASVSFAAVGASAASHVGARS